MALDSLTNSSHHELPAGTSLLNGAYRITGTLSRGGFGIIYLAKDALERMVVLKEFPTGLCVRDGATVKPTRAGIGSRFDLVLRCFLNEAQVLAMLSHPSIVRVHQVFEENGTTYAAMDHLPGTDLLEVIETQPRRLQPAEIITLARKLIGTVGHLHRSGLLHCDISPDNVILTPAGEPVLIDFGAARAVAPLAGQTYVGPRVAKDGYSPPEQYLPGANLGRSSDLYALAASLHHLISGALPEPAERRLAARNAGRADPCVALAKLRPDGGTMARAGFPAGFLESIDRAMAVEPAARFASADDWLAALTPRVVRPEKPVILLRRSAIRTAPMQSMAAGHPVRAEQPAGV
ncbi:MAG: hypothetical protein B7Z10_10925 [Rhodobacterales bacterium 32-66-7]|nr:MAG: hypothetical protein B7Z10_10925 [Rhodobacterales bacterium 32-66-7]